MRVNRLVPGAALLTTIACAACGTTSAAPAGNSGVGPPNAGIAKSKPPSTTTTNTVDGFTVSCTLQPTYLLGYHGWGQNILLEPQNLTQQPLTITSVVIDVKYPNGYIDESTTDVRDYVEAGDVMPISGISTQYNQGAVQSCTVVKIVAH